MMFQWQEILRLRSQVDVQQAEIDRLLRWKEEACEVLARWDGLYVGLSDRGELGQHKSDVVAAEINRLRAVIDDVADLHEPMSVDYPRCLSCGDWPCPTHLIVCDECKEARRG